MTANRNFEVIIVGGSYAGLSAAMALGRSMRKVLIIDSGKPCNRQTPHAHNFITQDGHTPRQIAETAKEQVLKYDTIQFYTGLAINGVKTAHGFEIKTQSGEVFYAKKLLFTTGVTDQMPDIMGFSDCWGISILHCPYCHGYEVKGEIIGLIGNGELGFEFCRMLSNWSNKLVLFTNGKSTLTPEQTEKINSHDIQIIENEILAFEHQKGHIQNIKLKDAEKKQVSAVFAKVGFEQHCEIPEQLDCEITEQGFIKVDDFYKTTIPGVYAAGDNTSMFRALSLATAAGTKAGAFINRELIEEAF
ncbi:NAD(P)/FAD-dependent oxidoreductase [Catalinimonas niigatensis]|uniref:NAD(P)/FAD-dependent oxidoreductase n=1 Tax=Catalinimonas niigatensis TaxID=1397264 RepID=UPI00266715D5|nr:NAD(P)/FAD-dependent oxidoreductase [Catalinimonas niigatensis]WPP50193.1 NAD(P)/FAD-dependent oxidoreductase [Catalinimonas niigatensis]